LTRSEVARRLGVTVTSVRWYERTGKLNPKKDPRGVRRFDEAEVEAFAQERGVPLPGDPTTAIIARVFQMIADGKGLPEIVIATGLMPSRVRALYVEYITPIRYPVPTPSAASNDTQRHTRPTTSPNGTPDAARSGQ
jgi:hypothetical protein